MNLKNLKNSKNKEEFGRKILNHLKGNKNNKNNKNHLTEPSLLNQLFDLIDPTIYVVDLDFKTNQFSTSFLDPIQVIKGTVMTNVATFTSNNEHPSLSLKNKVIGNYNIISIDKTNYVCKLNLNIYTPYNIGSKTVLSTDYVIPVNLNNEIDIEQGIYHDQVSKTLAIVSGQFLAIIQL